MAGKKRKVFIKTDITKRASFIPLGNVPKIKVELLQLDVPKKPAQMVLNEGLISSYADTVLYT